MDKNKPKKYKTKDLIKCREVRLTKELLDSIDLTKVIYAEVLNHFRGLGRSVIYIADEDNQVTCYIIDLEAEEVGPDLTRQAHNKLLGIDDDQIFRFKDELSTLVCLGKTNKFIAGRKFFVYDNKYRIDGLGDYLWICNALNDPNDNTLSSIIKSFNAEISSAELDDRISRVKSILSTAYITYKNKRFIDLLFAFGGMDKEVLKFISQSEDYVSQLIMRLESLGIISKAGPDYGANRRLLISSIEEYNERMDYQGRSFCETVESFALNDKSVKYDLIMMYNISCADGFMKMMHEYCRETTDRDVKELFVSEQDIFKASDILRTVSRNDANQYYDNNFDLFHSYVTQYMLKAGWMIELFNIIFSIDGIDALRLDIVRYILANWNWLVGIYDPKIFDLIATRYGGISLQKSAIEEDSLRRQFIRQTLKLKIEALQGSIESDIDKYVEGSKRHPFFDEDQRKKS